MSRELILELVDVDDVAVSNEDDHVLVTSSGHDGEDSIELEAVHEKIDGADHRVRNTTATWSGDGDAQLQLEVVPRGD